VKYGDRAIWVGHEDIGTDNRQAWRNGYRTYELKVPLAVFRLDSLGARHVARTWFAVGQVSLPMEDYLADYAVLNPRVAANALGGTAVALDRWLLTPKSVVNVGAAGPQSPFGVGLRDVPLPGGAIQLELLTKASPPATFLGRELVQRHVTGP